MIDHFDTQAYRNEQRALESLIIHNYYRIDWCRLTGSRWEDRPAHLVELHNAFEYLRKVFPVTREQADEFRAEMERVRDALAVEYEQLELERSNT